MGSMPRRVNTVIVVPHSKARFFKFTFSTRALVIAASCLTTALVLSVVAIVYTGGAVHRRAELKRLNDENRQLQEVNRQLEGTVAEVQARLDEFEERTARLALAAGLENEPTVFPEADERSERVGSGGPYDRLPESPEQLRSQGEWIAHKLDLVEERMTSTSQELAAMPTIAPVLGVITDGYGKRRDPFTGRWANHMGLDIAARIGTPVMAPADGVVVFSGYDGGFGKMVRLAHGFGYTTIFGHLSKILVKPGDEIRRGDTIGLLGSTGRSTGPHLHYEVHEDGRSVNPLYYILNAY